jgi:hypothetical protein
LLKIQKKPSRIFITSETLARPYEKKLIQDNRYGHERGYWTLVRQKEYKTPTNETFWRLKLMKIRYRVWTINAYR